MKDRVSSKMPSLCQDRDEGESYIFLDLSMVGISLKACVRGLEGPVSDSLIRMKRVWQSEMWRLCLWCGITELE